MPFDEFLVRTFLCDFQQRTQGCVFVAGGSVLQYYRNPGGNNYGDVDVYVHLRPFHLLDWQKYGLRWPIAHYGRYQVYNNSIEYLEETLEELYLRKRIRHTDYHHSVFNPRDNLDVYGQYSWMRVHLGIVAMSSFRLHRDGNADSTSPTIQVIFVNDYPSHPTDSWIHKVLSHYDINVCQVYIIPPLNHQETFEVQFFHESVKSHIDNGTMCFTFRPFQPLNVVRDRLRKYEQRGFTVVHVSFDSLLPQWWQDHVCAMAGQFLPSQLLQHASGHSNHHPGSCAFFNCHECRFARPSSQLRYHMNDGTERQLWDDLLRARARERQVEITPRLGSLPNLHTISSFRTESLDALDATEEWGASDSMDTPNEESDSPETSDDETDVSTSTPDCSIDNE